ncbi:MAG TPA: carboxypeptidase-like regulatory domain-containing protein [Actinomycetota bacterium]|nr:carboxypeptidase-like regulatory domain-containing protein [Actinomycetota bacterium]
MRGERLPRMLARAGVGVWLVTALAWTPPAVAQTTVGIQGTVQNGTTDEPVVGVEVSLQLFSQQGDLGVMTATSGRSGRFSFDQLPEGVAGYQLAASYGGAEYRTVAQAYTAGQSRRETVTVFEPTDDPGVVTLTDYIVWLDRTDTGMAVQHDLSWSNSGNRAYVGDGDAVVSVPLPADATNLQYLGTFLEIPGAIRDGAYASNAPIVPGTTTATLRYEAPALSALTLPIGFATDNFQLFVPQDIRVRSPALRLSGTVEDQGLTYTVYQGQGLTPGTAIEAAMEEGSGDGGGGLAIWMLLAAAALAATLVLGVWFVARRRAAGSSRPRRARRRARRPERTPRTEAAPKPIRVAQPSGNGHDGPAAGEDVDLIIDEIAALDLSFEKGLLDERRYTRLRVAAKDRLLRAERARAGEGRPT